MRKERKPIIFAIVRGQGVYVSDAKPPRRSKDTKTRAQRILKRKKAEQDFEEYQKRLKFRGLAHRFIDYRKWINEVDE